MNIYSNRLIEDTPESPVTGNTHLVATHLDLPQNGSAASDARANGGCQSIDRALTLPYIIVTKDGVITLFWL
jgi:hypothetical protein